MQRSQPSSRSGRRRPLSSDADPSLSDADPSLPPTLSRPPQVAQELEFPPLPPPNRGPVSAPTDLASSERGSGGGGGDTTAAAVAPGVTVKLNSRGSSSNRVQDPIDPLFGPFGDTLENGGDGLRSVDGGDADSGASGSVGGATSLDDAWEIDGGGADGGEAAGPLGAAVGAAAPTENRGDGSGGDGVGSVSSAHSGDGAGAVAQSSTEVQLEATPPGDERAHKMWVTGGGDGNSVSGEKTFGCWFFNCRQCYVHLDYLNASPAPCLFSSVGFPFCTPSPPFSRLTPRARVESRRIIGVGKRRRRSHPVSLSE